MSKGRSSSSPPALASSPEDTLVWPFQGRAVRPSSLGICGLDSPTSYMKLSKVNYLMRVTHGINPLFDVSMFNGSIYVMIRLRPRAPHIHMLQPHLYHVTLVRAKWSSELEEDLFTNRLAVELGMAYRLMAPPQNVKFGQAPWRKSFNFGFSEDLEFTDFCVSLRAAATLHMRRIDPEMRIQPHRELHASWL